ncbi:hypothetical protein F4802DRAFT_601540 [Xylaria palmicola]|nr:hypothetical protein F4802DRAFT_601540 [Xylaria palmicola]
MPVAIPTPTQTMVASLRSPRRLLAATFVVTFLFLVLALRHRESLAGSSPVRAPLRTEDSNVDREHEHPPGQGGHDQGQVKVQEQEPEPEQEQEKEQEQDPRDRELELVVASVQAEDTSWLHAHLPDWHKNIYVADDPGAALTVPRNKGREAMVYLTYLIDRYDSLPRGVLFVHASRFAWHNDDPDYDALPALRRFRLPHLRRAGYVNLRCVWVIGCPAEIRPALDAADADAGGGGPVHARHVYKAAFEALLPGAPVPDLVAVSCCSQFAVTREAIRSRPRADYIRYREWLLATPLDDALNGRVFEFAWHIIFGKEAVHCPSAAECYCDVFGLCDLPCQDDSCAGRYTLPPYSTLPKGWPLVGWDQEERNFTGPL